MQNYPSVPHSTVELIVTATAVLSVPMDSDYSYWYSCYPPLSLLPSCLLPPSSLCYVTVSNCKGMSVTEDKGFIVVKKIENGSVLAKDGRIRVGDRILSINGKAVEGLSLPKVKLVI